MAIQLHEIHRITVDTYRRAGELGLLPERGVELVDGLVVAVSPKGARHRHAVNTLNRQFVLQSAGNYEVNCDSLSLRLSAHDMPDPDIALAKPGDWSRRDPAADDLTLIVEVADSSLQRDLNDKYVRYASAGICEYWVVDLDGNCVHVFRVPEGDRYRIALRATAGATISPEAHPTVVIDVGLVLGQP